MKNTKNWKMSALDVLKICPIVPVIVINNLDHAVPLAKALVAGGVKVLEVTLRTTVAIEAIRMISEEVPEAVVGAGTVVSEDDLHAVAQAGGVFAISPGLTPTLLSAAINGPIALIPGISTPSELMFGMEYGLREFKFFPAVAAGDMTLARDPLTQRQVFNGRAELRDLSDELVACDQRHGYDLLRPLVPVPDVYVGAADRGLFHLDQNVVGTDLRHGNPLHPQADLRFRFHQCPHFVFHVMISISRPTWAKASIARSSCSIVCAADICVRIRS